MLWISAARGDGDLILKVAQDQHGANDTGSSRRPGWAATSEHGETEYPVLRRLRPLSPENACSIWSIISVVF
jgi:hypothetical protein